MSLRLIKKNKENIFVFLTNRFVYKNGEGKAVKVEIGTDESKDGLAQLREGKEKAKVSLKEKGKTDRADILNEGKNFTKIKAFVKNSVNQIRTRFDLIAERTKDKVENRKLEMEERLNIYTRKKDDVYTLKYKAVGGMNHEKNIGVSDIVVDLDIKALKVIRNGQEFLLIRKNLDKPDRRGRRSNFVDKETGAYFPTWSGDQFMILSDEDLDEETKKRASLIDGKSKKNDSVVEGVESGDKRSGDGTHLERGNESLESVSRDDVAWFGDSLTVGMKAGGARNLIVGKRFDKKKNKMVPAGTFQGGIQTGLMRKRFDKFIALRKAGKFRNIKRISFFGGTNDIMSLKSPDKIMDNILYIAKKARDNGISMVVSTVPKWEFGQTIRNAKANYRKFGWGVYKGTSALLTRNIEELNKDIRKAYSSGLIDGVVDLEAEIANNNSNYPKWGDGLHFDRDGSKNLSRFIMKKSDIA